MKALTEEWRRGWKTRCLRAREMYLNGKTIPEIALEIPWPPFNVWKCLEELREIEARYGREKFLEAGRSLKGEIIPVHSDPVIRHLTSRG